MKCQGWRRYGGVFTFGPVRWEQCSNEAIVNLTVKQEGETETLPGCMSCWNECISKGIEILEVVPIQEEVEGEPNAQP